MPRPTEDVAKKSQHLLDHMDYYEDEEVIEAFSIWLSLTPFAYRRVAERVHELTMDQMNAEGVDNAIDPV